MRKIFSFFLIICICLSLFGCSGNAPEDKTGIALTDVFGNTVYLSGDASLASGYASFAECVLLSGNRLCGVTEDAITEHDLSVEENTAIIGSVKQLNLEAITALDPDYLLLSADLTAHLSLDESLTALGIPHGYFRVDVFDDYKALMQTLCAISGREDLFAQNVTAVEKEIAAIRQSIPKTTDTVLLLRAYSTGVKAKSDDNLAGMILKEFGLVNIADNDHSMLEELSLEQIILSDPDHIFVLTMGDEAAALSYLEQNFQNNPAWNKLRAIKQGNYHLLPKQLFHYKPNHRWSESYAYLAKCIFPDIE